MKSSNSHDFFSESYAGKKVLIAGGLGFIGSNLARRLLGLGARITLVDSLIQKYCGNRANVADFAGQVSIRITDVRDPHAIKHLNKGQAFLKAREIGTNIHYPLPIYRQPGYRGRFWMPSKGLPEKEKAAKEVLSLLLYPELSGAALMRVAGTINIWA
jgi:hypothetical protein